MYLSVRVTVCVRYLLPFSLTRPVIKGAGTLSGAGSSSHDSTIPVTLGGGSTLRELQFVSSSFCGWTLERTGGGTASAGFNFSQRLL